MSDATEKALADALGMAYADAADDDRVVVLEEYVASRLIAAGYRQVEVTDDMVERAATVMER